jgi:Dyp-type peroxidase family
MSRRELRENDDRGSYRRELQANILRGIHFPHARFLFVAFEKGEGRAWLDWLRSYISDGRTWRKCGTPDVATTIAFTHSGLKALGVRDEILGQFRDAFQKGMRARSVYLGDDPDQSKWDPVFTKEPIHALVSLYGSDLEDTTILDQRVQTYCNHHGVRKLDVQEAALLPGDKEHFGFRDGISQPIWHARRGWQSDVPIKQFLIFPSNWSDGYSKDGDPGLQLGRLGTYLVYRKLEQRVAEFHSFTTNWNGLLPDHVAAKMIGRWHNGTPVTETYLPPTKRRNDDDSNDFDFHDDRDGLKCPFGAHISRVNPRSRLGGVSERRILRRGIPYGPPVDRARMDDGAVRRGLVFIALNANIERQFEFLQKGWINDRSLTAPDGVDPVANTRAKDLGNFRLDRAGDFQPLEKFVQLRGGEYFFMPRMKALELLAKGEFSAS